MKTLYLLSGLLLVASQAEALICPNAEQIRTHQIAPFVELDMDNDEPASPELKREFEKNVAHFHAAEWLPNTYYPSQCYYTMKASPFALVSLSTQQNVEPQGQHWIFDTSHTRKRCESDKPQDCQF